jgi:actin-related protein 5
VVVEKSEAEQAAALEKRKEHGRRLQEMQAKQRADKVRLKSRIS